MPDRIRWPSGWLMAFMALTILAGGLLRLACARGDLWLDEIFTLRLLSHVSSPWQVFYAINRDNNHLLNSLYIELLGADTNPLHIRGLALLCGILSIPAAGLAAGGLNGSSWRGATAMVLFAASFPMTYYSSEARGYAGLGLFFLLAIHAVTLSASPARKRVYLMLCTAFGTLFQPLMVILTGCLFLSVFATLLYEKHPWKSALYKGVCLFGGAGLFIALYLVYFVVLNHFNPYRIGSYQPSTWDGFLPAYWDIFSSLFGLESGAGRVICLGCALLVFASFASNPFLAITAALVVFAMPVALFVLGFPNLYNVRYFIGSWIVMILLVNHCLNLWLLDMPRRRLWGWAALMAIMVLNLHATAHFVRIGRGHYQDIARLIAATDPPTYAANREDNQTFVMDYYAAVLHLKLTYVAPEDWCTTKPEWLILTLVPFPDRMTYGPPGCTANFEKAETFEATGFGIYPWVLYRRVR